MKKGLKSSLEIVSQYGAVVEGDLIGQVRFVKHSDFKCVVLSLRDSFSFRNINC